MDSGGVCLMTVIYRGSGIYTGLDADTKPTSGVPTNSLFIKTDTGEISKYNGSSWDIIIGASKTETLTNKTLTAPSINGSKLATSTKTTTYTATVTDHILLGDATSAAFTITLPAASGNTGLVFIFKKIDSTTNIVTIDGASSETIDGLLTWQLREQFDYIKIVCDGTNWIVLAHSDIPSPPSTRILGSTANRYYYGNSMSSTTTSTFTLTAAHLYAVPFVIERVRSIDTLAVNVTSNPASSAIRLGIYTSKNVYPDALVVESTASAQIDSSTTGFKTSTITPTQVLQPGLYFLTALSNSNPQVRSTTSGDAAPFLGVDNQNATTAKGTGYDVGQAYGALPSTYPAAATILTGGVISVAARFV